MPVVVRNLNNHFYNIPRASPILIFMCGKVKIKDNDKLLPMYDRFIVQCTASLSVVLFQSSHALTRNHSFSKNTIKHSEALMQTHTYTHRCHVSQTRTHVFIRRHTWQIRRARSIFTPNVHKLPQTHVSCSLTHFTKHVQTPTVTVINTHTHQLTVHTRYKNT